MTNEEKAKEIGRKWYNDDAPLVAYRSALQMAKWKDKQFNETLKRANESVTKAHEEGAKFERKRIIEKACEWLESNLCCYDEDYRGIDSGNSLIEDFKKAMEE